MTNKLTISKLIILRGIPGSGKSTYAKKCCKDDNFILRVNRDDIREMMGYSFNNFDNDIESVITKMQNVMIRESLKNGKTVIVDNLNLKQSYVNDLNTIAEEVGNVWVHEKYFNVTLEEALRNNRLRGTTVAESVIEKLYYDFKQIKICEDRYYPEHNIEVIQQDESLPSCVICDLDGTLCLFDREKKNPYDRDFENDEINKAVQLILYRLQDDISNGTQIIFVSGRTNNFWDVTLEWLKSYGFGFYDYENYIEGDCQLIMREKGDNRKDSIVKQEIYDKYIKGKYYVDFVLDDRNQVVNMWRRNGLTCLQVSEGNF